VAAWIAPNVSGGYLRLDRIEDRYPAIEKLFALPERSGHSDRPDAGIIGGRTRFLLRMLPETVVPYY